jgi:hypothetical protein
MSRRPIFNEDKPHLTGWILGPEDMALRQCLLPNFHHQCLQSIRMEDLTCLAMTSKLQSAGSLEPAKPSRLTAPLDYAPAIGQSTCWWLVYCSRLSPHISILTCTPTDIKNEILMQINSDWSRKWGAPLQLWVFIHTKFHWTDAVIPVREDTSIRWHSNRIPIQNTVLLSLGEFYRAHSGPSVASQYLKGHPGIWNSVAKAKRPFACLELWIDWDAVNYFLTNIRPLHLLIDLHWSLIHSVQEANKPWT